MKTLEEWLTIAECPEYEVSNRGRIRRINDKSLVMITRKKNVYKACRLKNNSESKTYLVHRVVLKAFSPAAEPSLEVKHAERMGRMDFKYRKGKDNPSYGRNHSEDAIANMRKAHNKNNDHPNYKLSDQHVYDIKQRRFNGETLIVLAKEYNQTIANISLICKGKRREDIAPQYNTGRTKRRKLRRIAKQYSGDILLL